MGVLALDLGSTTGWAFEAAPGMIISGSLKLGTDEKRFYRFLEALDAIEPLYGVAVTRVVYEKVEAHNSTYAAQVYGGFVGVMCAWAAQRGLTPDGYGVGVIKKFATGVGSASKTGMVQAAQVLGFNVRDDNEADAVCLLHLALSGAKPKVKGRKSKVAARFKSFSSG